MERQEIQKVMTLKTGNLVFSRFYDKLALQEKFIEARITLATISEIPVLPYLSAGLNQELIRKSIFSTAALEGNPLSEQQVGEILDGGDQGVEAGQAQQEILNLKEAYQRFLYQENQNQPVVITQDLVRDIHRVLTQKIKHKYNQPGSFRNHKVQVGDSTHGGIYTPPKTLPDLENLKGFFCGWINGPEMAGEELLARAALAHFHLAKIHPFSDGNGRVARLLEGMIIESAGIKRASLSMSNYYYRHMDDYYWAFSQAERDRQHDVTAFVEFVLNAATEALNQLKTSMFCQIRRFTFESFLDQLRKDKTINQRQHDLIEIAMGDPEGFTLGDLFAKAPYRALYQKLTERTARRDIERLAGAPYLLKHEKTGRYTVDLTALDRLAERAAKT